MKRLVQIMIIAFQILILTSFNSILGQSNWEIGLAPSYEIQKSNGRFGVGILANHKLSNNFSIEAGLYYRSILSEFLVQNPIMPISTINIKVRENYLWAPLLAKRNGKIINISSGITLQKYIGYSDINESSNTQIRNYEVKPDWLWGIMTKFGHSISISEKFLIEPEVSANFLFYEQIFIYNLGVCAKYRF